MNTSILWSVVLSLFVNLAVHQRATCFRTFPEPTITTTTEEYFPTENGTSSEINNSTEVEYSKAFLSCDHVGINETDRFEFLPDGSVRFPEINHTLDRLNHVYNGDIHTLYVCEKVLDLFGREPPKSKFPSALSTVTVVGTALSTVCILLHIGMFLAFKKLRNLPGYTLCSLCVALLATYVCVFITDNLGTDDDCTALGLVKAYSLMAAFLWMNVMSYDIWRSLRMATNKLRLTAERSLRRRLAMYSAYAWGVPLGVFGVAYAVHSTQREGGLYRLDIKPNTCWFRHKPALLVYFAAPIFATIAANTLLFCSSHVMIRTATAGGVGEVKEQRSRLLVSVRLAIAMGLVWAFAVIAAYTGQLWLNYLSVVFTVLQGVFIFFSFSFTDTMKKEVKRAVQRRKDSSFPTQITSSHQMSTSV